MSMHKPTLSVETDARGVTRWLLHAHLSFKCEHSFTLAVRNNCGDPTFTRQIWHDGDMLEGLTREEFEERIGDIRENEDMSDADARSWLLERVEVINGGGARWAIFEELKRYWDALTMLVVPTASF